MSKISEETIREILQEKHFSCTNIEEYQNLDTVLHLTCEKGHKIDAPLKVIRNQNFVCPQCEGLASKDIMVTNKYVPQKTGYRIVALDNATYNIGISIFDDGKLVYYQPLSLSGDVITRIEKNRNFLESVILERWCPDFIVVEDIQYQNNLSVYKTLAMLLGSTLCTIHKYGVKFDTVQSNVWRAHFMVNKPNRETQKLASIQKVKEMYGIIVNDDVAEAILIGKYAADCLKCKMTQKLF